MTEANPLMNGQVKAKSQRPLVAMLFHAANHSPYYRDQEWALRMRAGERFRFGEIPITPKALVRTHTKQFYSSFVPTEDGGVHDKPTSGSTGAPMLLRKTDRHFQFNALENQRLKSGWGYDRHKRIAHIAMPNDDHPIGKLEEEDLPGGAHSWKLYTCESVAAFELYRHTCATLAVGSPSIIRAALGHASETSQTLSLQLVLTRAEVVSDELRTLVRQIPGCRLLDVYGCTETGVIAVQCPVCDAYHPADQHLALEILTDDGPPAGPGEMGRVIVTPLFNRAMPLIRYETGDYVVLAKSNQCPRSPQAIKSIVGREKNLFRLPDGRKIVPRLPQSVVTKIPWRQYKLIQTTLTDIELHYIPQDETTEISQELAQDMVNRYMAAGFRVRCVRVKEIPRARSGKYLSHECLV
jgi:phenylacetate-CoA ligase